VAERNATVVETVLAKELCHYLLTEQAAVLVDSAVAVEQAMLLADLALADDLHCLKGV
jgi:hypothetical protein